jgi:hypothetical protein
VLDLWKRMHDWKGIERKKKWKRRMNEQRRE